MTIPGVQTLSDAVVLQGPVVAEVAYLVNLGLRHRANLDGTAPSVRQRALLRMLTDTAEAVLAVPDARGHADTRATPDLAESTFVGEMNTAEAARLLGITPRHVRRLARSLDGRRVKGTWSFDRAAVTRLYSATTRGHRKWMTQKPPSRSRTIWPG
jgi:hypothetical protein